MSIVREQIRDGVVSALMGLTTTGSRVYPSRMHALPDAELPALRVYTPAEDLSIAAKGVKRVRAHIAELIVECCSKKSDGMDNELLTMVGEVMVRLDANQQIAGVTFIEPQRIEDDMEAEAEREVGISRMSYTVHYETVQGAPDVAL
jgi:hypothetical protein